MGGVVLGPSVVGPSTLALPLYADLEDFFFLACCSHF
jgi:hypothetical protein